MIRSLIAVCAVACPLVAQGVPERRLPPAEIAFPEPFSAVSGLRELADGRVLVADLRERALVLVDPRDRSISTVGREGSGPLEWQRPSQLFPIRGDTTWLLDPGNRRLLVIGPTGVPTGTLDQPRIVTHNGPGSTSTYTVVPRFTDRDGRVYLESVIVRFDPTTGRPVDEDSVAIVRLSRTGDTTDTLAWIRTPRPSTGASTASGAATVTMRRTNPFAPRDEWVVFPDGITAVIRANPYRTEWIRPDGSRRIGSEVTYAPHAITAQEKRDVNAREQQRMRGAFTMSTSSGSGGERSQSAPVMPSLPEIADWPAAKPPFLMGRENVWATPDGALWVRRTQAAGDPGDLFDVFASDGHRTHQVRFPPGARLAGFGRSAVYTTTADADDLLTLRRHPLP